MENKKSLGMGADGQPHWEQPLSAFRAQSSATHRSVGLRVISVSVPIFLLPFFVMWNCGAFDQPEPKTQAQRDWNGCVEQLHGLADANADRGAEGTSLSGFSQIVSRCYADTPSGRAGLKP